MTLILNRFTSRPKKIEFVNEKVAIIQDVKTPSSELYVVTKAWEKIVAIKFFLKICAHTYTFNKCFFLFVRACACTNLQEKFCGGHLSFCGSYKKNWSKDGIS